MLKILTVIIFLQRADAHDPGEFYWLADENMLKYHHILNMTQSLCKDAFYKLRMADIFQTRYKNTRMYDLGLIAANVMEKFRHMLKTYRYYSNHNNFKNNDHTITEIMNAYSSMQGDYNDILAGKVLFHETVVMHAQKDVDELEEAKVLAKKYRISVAAIRQMQKNGIKLTDYAMRRLMQTGTKVSEFGRLKEKGDEPREDDPIAPNINTWTPKKNDSNKEEEEYKKKLRYIKWAEKWDGFNGEIEGVHIADTIDRLRLNDSNFLLKELKGAV